MTGAAARLKKERAIKSKTPLRLLVVEDDRDDAELILSELRKGGFEPDCVIIQDEAEFVQALRNHLPEIVLADYYLPHWKGLETLEVLNREDLDIPVILVSGAVGDENAVECIKQGITDYVLKDGLARLPEAVRRALDEKRQRDLQLQAQKSLDKKVEELARSNAELQQFAYVASHDLQEPLRMVASYTQLLAQRYKGNLGADADLFIGYAVDGANRMQSLIQDLLDYSRVGTMARELVDTSVEYALEQALMNLRNAIAEKGALVTHDPLPRVLGDNTQLTELFQNLISNGIKYYQGSKVPKIHISAVPDGGQNWTFSIKDNGIGIAAQYFDRIFVMFQRLHRREEFAGNGIGLAICKKIVERHGSTISVESQPGKGSTFRFTLSGSGREPEKENGA